MSSVSGDKPVLFFTYFSCIFPAIWRVSRAWGLTLGKLGYFKIRSHVVAEKTTPRHFGLTRSDSETSSDSVHSALESPSQLPILPSFTASPPPSINLMSDSDCLQAVEEQLRVQKEPDVEGVVSRKGWFGWQQICAG